jgi:hypothetical protein
MTTVIDMVLDGKSVCTPLTVYRPGLRGTFTNAADGFDPSRHKVVARMRAGPRLRRALRDARVEKVDAVRPAPRPHTYIDVASGAQDGPLTAGGPGRLLGRLLHYDPADAAQGVFFIASGGAETRVETLVVNDPGHLAFIVPTLAAGDYKVEVRAVVNGDQEVRSGELDAVLTVS